MNEDVPAELARSIVTSEKPSVFTRISGKSRETNNVVR